MLFRSLHIDPYQGCIRYLGRETSVVGRHVRDLRDLAVATGGSLVIDRANAELKAEVGAWGSLGSAGTLMSRIKMGLDPNNLLSPGRFYLGTR